MTVLRFFIPYSNHKGCGPEELTLYGMAVITRKAPRVGANSSSVFAFDMHYK